MKRIYLVEDHQVMRSTLVTLLQREKDLIVCGQAASAAEALAGLESAQPDLVLLDLSLPDTNGLDLLAQIQRRWPDLPCVILSGHDRDIYAEQALAAGARGYVAKHEVSDILPTLRQALTS